MKTIIILAIIAFVFADSGHYILEKMDVNKMIDNLDELNEFTNCLLEKIPCNKVYESYRVNALEAIEQSCKKCRPHEKHMIWQYLQALKTKLPDSYLAFRHKYDPENKYFDAHETELSKYANV